MTKYSPMIVWLARRNKTANTDILITGKRRMGKSWFALALAWRFYRYLEHIGIETDGFSIQRNVIFEVDEWLRGIKSGKFQRYDMVILDDAGTQLPSQKWYDKVVMTTLLVYQSYAEYGINTVITVPINKLVSQKLIPLSHLYGRMQGRGWCKFYSPHAHETRDKTMYPHFADVRTSAPPKDLTDEYIAAKKAYLNKIYTQYDEEFKMETRARRKKLVASTIEVQDVIEAVLAAPELFRDARGVINRNLIWAKVEGCDKHKAGAAVINIEADYPEIYKKS